MSECFDMHFIAADNIADKPMHVQTTLSTMLAGLRMPGQAHTSCRNVIKAAGCLAGQPTTKSKFHTSGQWRSCVYQSASHHTGQQA